MHGLSTIRKINRDPHGDHGIEFAGGVRTGGPDFDHRAPRTLADRTAEHKAAGFVPGQGFLDKDVPVMERIESALDGQPPFLKFWAKLNEQRGGEVGYKVAREEFAGGPTPEGAMAFIGREGLRAVVAPAVEGKRAYYGEYREVTEMGTIWHRVGNSAGHPIVYQYPDFALIAATRERNERIEKAFR